MPFYDVNAGAQRPNYLGTAVQAYMAGTDRRLQREQEERTNQLRALAPAIIDGDPNAYAQGAALDPQAAQGYQQAGDAQLRRLRGFIDYVDQARASGNPNAVNAALKAGAPFLSQLTGGRAPTEWTPDMDAGWEQLKAKVSMAGSGSMAGVQSTYIDGDGNRVAIMRDGSTQILGKNDAGMSNQTISVVGPDGRPQQMTFNKRTGNYEPASMGGQAPMPQSAPAPVQDITASIAENANRMIAAGIPPAQVDAWAVAQGQSNVPTGMTMGGGGSAPNAMSAPTPPAGPSPFVGQSPGEKAAEEEAAKRRTALEFSDAEAQAAARATAMEESARRTAALQLYGEETEAEVDRTRRLERAKFEEEKAKLAPKARAAMDQATSRVNRIDSMVDAILPRVDASTAGWVGGKLSEVEGTAAFDLRKDISTLQALAGFEELSAMRASSPTGGALGAITEKELTFLQSTIRNIENSQSPEQLRRNLEAFRREVKESWGRVNEAYQRDYGAGADAASPAPSTGRIRFDANGNRI